MKNIDQLLSRSAPLPRRSLDATFTTRVVNEIKQHPAPKGFIERTKIMIASAFKKPAAALVTICVVVVLLGSAAYATDGFTKLPEFLNVFFRSSTTLSDGKKLYTIDTKSCAAEWYDPAKDTKSSIDDMRLFRILDPQALDEQTFASMVQGNCDLAKARATVKQKMAALEAANPAYKGNVMMGGLRDMVTSTADNKIVVESIASKANASMSGGYTVTYGRFSQDVQIETPNGAGSQKNIAVGDTMLAVFIPT